MTAAEALSLRERIWRWSVQNPQLDVEKRPLDDAFEVIDTTNEPLLGSVETIHHTKPNLGSLDLEKKEICHAIRRQRERLNGEREARVLRIYSS